jgi:UDP:flavonoid glycosyltransferase YjiC (YdhE family)
VGGSDAPLIYATLGTVLGYMSIAADVYRTLVAAVLGTQARVLLTVGARFDPAVLGPVPAHVHVEAWVDQVRVLEHADKWRTGIVRVPEEDRAPAGPAQRRTLKTT